MNDKAMQSVFLEFDVSGFEESLLEIKSFFEELPQVNREFIDRFLCVLTSTEKVFDVHSKPSTTGSACDVVVTLELSDRCRSFMAVCRAGNVDWGIFDM